MPTITRQDTTYEKTDKRSRKCYEVKIHHAARLESGEDIGTWAHPASKQYPSDKVRQALEHSVDVLWPTGGQHIGRGGNLITVKETSAWALHRWYKNTTDGVDTYHTFLSFDVVFKARLPSHLPTEEQALEILGKVDFLIPDAMRTGEAVHAAALQLEARTSLAQHVLRHLSEDVIEKAREACRYDQRMAALNAELEAEKQVQVKRAVVLYEAKGLVFSDSEKPCEPIVLAAVLSSLHKAVEHRSDLVHRRRFDIIDPADLVDVPDIPPKQ